MIARSRYKPSKEQPSAIVAGDRMPSNCTS